MDCSVDHLHTHFKQFIVLYSCSLQPPQQLWIIICHVISKVISKPEQKKTSNKQMCEYYLFNLHFAIHCHISFLWQMWCLDTWNLVISLGNQWNDWIRNAELFFMLPGTASKQLSETQCMCSMCLATSLAVLMPLESWESGGSWR